VQTVWDNIWGIVQVVFLPDGKVMTVHKPGELHVYKSINSNSQVRVFVMQRLCVCRFRPNRSIRSAVCRSRIGAALL
jgi:hypothetical protein